ncbi:unnamed protein product [Lota lota]
MQALPWLFASPGGDHYVLPRLLPPLQAMAEYKPRRQLPRLRCPWCAGLMGCTGVFLHYDDYNWDWHPACTGPDLPASPAPQGPGGAGSRVLHNLSGD